MKRINNLIERIACYDNLLISAKEVIRGGKKSTYRSSYNILTNLRKFCELASKELTTGNFFIHGYREFEINENGKIRIIQSLCIYDRIILHAIMNILGKECMMRSFIRDTYSSMKGRGMMDGIKRLRNFLKDEEGTRYCLKLDIHKFYNSIDQGILINMLNRYIKDKILLYILTNVIHSFPKGLPIGFHSSQYLGNFYLSGLDRHVKQDLRVKYYLRYCDDIVILASSKEELWIIFNKLKDYITNNLKLSIKPNYQVFPVESRGIDFLGYVTRHSSTKIRKRIKKKALRKLSKVKSTKKIQGVLGSLTGWVLNCDTNPTKYSNISTIIKMYRRDRNKGVIGRSIGLKEYYDLLISSQEK